MQCPLCIEEVTLAPVATVGGARRAVGLPCCGQTICQSCLYHHVRSVFEEGQTGQGRSKLLCPMGCGQELTDKSIRKTISNEYPLGFFWNLCGKFAMGMLHSVGWFRLPNASYYAAWLNFNHSTQAIRDLERYEQWSTTVALRGFDGVMQCPAPDCSYRWLANPEYRRSKMEHERQKYFLWYSPPKPEPNIPLTWVEPEFLDINLAQDHFVERETRDGRRMVCAKCHTTFCGLCRQPWSISRNKCHDGSTCRQYRRKLPEDSDFNFVSQLANCRSCPGCSLRTHRIDGCNHMTCPCGKEWCYVCESNWNPWHYSCVDEPRRDDYRLGCAVM